MESLKQRPFFTLGVLLGLYVAVKISIIIFRYTHTLSARKNLVYMLVTVPRSDSKLDAEKDTKKDFKEIVGIAEQFFRSIHEIRELNLWNIIKVWLFEEDIISFEMVAIHKQLSFYVVTYKYYAPIIEKQITAFYADADIQYVPSYDLTKKGNVLRSYYMYLKRPFWFPVRTYKMLEHDPLNDLSNVLSKMEENEISVIQIMLRPKNPKWRKKACKMGTQMFKGKKHVGKLGMINSIFIGLLSGYDAIKGQTNQPGASGGDAYVRMLQTQEEVAKHVGEKSDQSGFDSVIRIFASSPQKQRVEDILNSIVVAFNVFRSDAMNYFQNRRIIPIWSISTLFLKWNFINRFFKYGEKSSLLVPDELASIYHFPNSRYNLTPVIKWLQYKVLPPPVDLPTEGILLGYNSYRGIKREVHFLKKDRSRHHYIIGQTGTGKSVFLDFMARQDIKNGDGVCIIDPHGDLIEDILEYIPKERVRDVILFNPSDQERPMGLNILEAKTSSEQDMASTQATEIFIKLFGDEIFGPRIQHYFRNACLTLMEDEEEGATLIDVPRIFTDFDFMKYKAAKVKNPVVRSFWEHEYAHTGERERQEMIPYFSAKFGPFITNTIMRNTIGQTTSAFNFRECMDKQKILLINLSKGKIGDLNTQLLGLIIVARLQMAAMSRVDMPEKDRKDFYLYVDEFQNFATDSFCSILSEARKYHLCLIMAHQYINQLVTTKFGVTSSQIRDAVFGNVGSLMSFKVGAEDGEYLAKEYAPVLSEQDIINIANYKAYIKLNISNSTSRPFSLETIYDTTGHNVKIAEIVREYSRMKYGRKRVFVDQEIAARIGFDYE
ncbi:type IV secretion system DNA-binding domain-containing protein [Candidatus Peregrinibacteria bacterium]|nr:type IV secretion system DNA-binding domain-containing protein [Candidatus Peregrinibacteria bacterium]